MKLIETKEEIAVFLSLPLEKQRELIRADMPERVKQLEKVLLGKRPNSYAGFRILRKGKLLKKSELAKQGCDVRKYSRFTVNVNQVYANRKRVKEAHANGTVKKRGLPPTSIVLSKVLLYNIKTGNYCLRLGTVDNPLCKRFSEWTVNNSVVSVSSIANQLEKKETEPNDSEWLHVNPNDVLSLH